MWRVKFWINWLRWCVRLKTLAPRGVGYITNPKMTPKDIERGREIARKHGL